MFNEGNTTVQMILKALEVVGWTYILQTSSTARELLQLLGPISSLSSNSSYSAMGVPLSLRRTGCAALYVYFTMFRAAAVPATMPLFHAHARLKPPQGPSTSRASPQA